VAAFNWNPARHQLESVAALHWNTQLAARKSIIGGLAALPVVCQWAENFGVKAASEGGFAAGSKRAPWVRHCRPLSSIIWGFA
jgi:hypothetical protein